MYIANFNFDDMTVAALVPQIITKSYLFCKISFNFRGSDSYPITMFLGTLQWNLANPKSLVFILVNVWISETHNNYGFNEALYSF